MADVLLGDNCGLCWVSSGWHVLRVQVNAGVRSCYVAGTVW